LSEKEILPENLKRIVENLERYVDKRISDMEKSIKDYVDKRYEEIRKGLGLAVAYFLLHQMMLFLDNISTAKELENFISTFLKQAIPIFRAAEYGAKEMESLITLILLKAYVVGMKLSDLAIELKKYFGRGELLTDSVRSLIVKHYKLEGLKEWEELIK
jgi:hypothetical protein